MAKKTPDEPAAVPPDNTREALRRISERQRKITYVQVGQSLIGRELDGQIVVLTTEAERHTTLGYWLGDQLIPRLVPGATIRFEEGSLLTVALRDFDELLRWGDDRIKYDAAVAVLKRVPRSMILDALAVREGRIERGELEEEK